MLYTHTRFEVVAERINKSGIRRIDESKIYSSNTANRHNITSQYNVKLSSVLQYNIVIICLATQQQKNSILIPQHQVIICTGLPPILKYVVIK